MKAPGQAEQLRHPKQEHRLRPIEDVEVGDLVWAWDDNAQAVVKRRVVRLYRHQDKPILSVTCVSGKRERQTIEATTEHPFWVESKGWVPAWRLKAGDLLKRIDGYPDMRVEGVGDMGAVGEVFNFEVDELHNYFVGRRGVLVHNASDLKPRTDELLKEARRLAKRVLENKVLRDWPERSQVAAEVPVTPSAPSGERRSVEPSRVNHTTMWYRHPEQMQPIIELANAFHASGRNGPFRVWSAAASTGAEAYSIAAELTLAVPKVPFEVIGTDRSAPIIQAAKSGVYQAVQIDPAGVRTLSRFGLKASTPFDRVTQKVPDQLRARTRFFTADLTQDLSAVGKVDVALVNNVLIYFDYAGKRSIISNISKQVVSGGRILADGASSPAISNGIYKGDFPNLTTDKRGFFVVK